MLFSRFFVVVAKRRKSSYLFRKHKSHDINIPKYHMDLYISIRSFAGINSIEKFKSDNMILITLLLFSSTAQTYFIWYLLNTNVDGDIFLGKISYFWANVRCVQSVDVGAILLQVGDIIFLSSRLQFLSLSSIFLFLLTCLLNSISYSSCLRCYIKLLCDITALSSWE